MTENISAEDPRIARLRIRTHNPPYVTRLAEEINFIIAAYDEALKSYELWKAEGQRMHAALLDIWHRSEPSNTKHMTFGLDPSVVVESVRAALALTDEQRRQIDAQNELIFWLEKNIGSTALHRKIEAHRSAALTNNSEGKKS
jgi:hypothetical protein